MTKGACGIFSSPSTTISTLQVLYRIQLENLGQVDKSLILLAMFKKGQTRQPIKPARKPEAT
tara:strand:- start:74 stop:259 length:186 start_codon:yes stop_codon:yes gene_type:complete